jgi:glucokinase
LEELSDRANKGEKKAQRFWKDTAVHIGNGLSNVVNLLNPQAVVLGGGISKSFDLMIDTIEKTVQMRAMDAPASIVKIKKAQLGDDAGIIGAYVLVENAQHNFKKEA